MKKSDLKLRYNLRILFRHVTVSALIAI